VCTRTAYKLSLYQGYRGLCLAIGERVYNPNSIPVGRIRKWLAVKSFQKRMRNAREFEQHVVQNVVSRWFPESRGWIIEPQYCVSDGTRVDCAVHRYYRGRHERAVIEIKHVTILTERHVEQLDNYARRFCASYRCIVVPFWTLVTDQAADALDWYDIDLKRAKFKD
jgi:hypothetical protein